jgi:hypothetical protein
MKIKTFCLSTIVFITLFFAGCNDNKQTKTEKELSQTDDKAAKKDAANNNIQINAPDFADPELKLYFNDYTNYLKKVLTAINNQDESGSIKLFTEEGRKFDNRNEMEQKAQAQEKEKFNTWLMQTIPYQKIIVQSDYYKKFSEEYYKKVKEDFKKKNL